MNKVYERKKKKTHTERERERLRKKKKKEQGVNVQRLMMRFDICNKREEKKKRKEWNGLGRQCISKVLTSRNVFLFLKSGMSETEAVTEKKKKKRILVQKKKKKS